MIPFKLKIGDTMPITLFIVNFEIYFYLKKYIFLRKKKLWLT